MSIEDDFFEDYCNDLQHQEEGYQEEQEMRERIAKNHTTNVCTPSGEIVVLNISPARYQEIQNKLKTGHIQNIAPELPPCHRELFITGMGPHEFAKMFGGACTNWEAKANQCIVFKNTGKCLYDDIKLLTEDQLEELMYGPNEPDGSDQARDYEDAKDIPGG